jgi:amidase
MLIQRYEKTYIERIAQVNSTIRAIAEINQASIVIARQKDHERSQGSYSGILHGVPILVKNLFLTTDGLKCTCRFFFFFLCFSNRNHEIKTAQMDAQGC